MSKNHDFGLDSSRVTALLRCLCFLLARVPLTAAASESEAVLRRPKAGVLRRVRRFERMPDRFDRVGERPAAAGAEEVMVGLIAVLMVGVSSREVKIEELEIRGCGWEKVFNVKLEGLCKLSSVSIFFLFEDDALKSTGSTFSESDKSRAM